MLSETILDIAIGKPAVESINRGLYKAYAELKRPVPTPPYMLDKRILYTMPISLTMTILEPSTMAPFKNDCPLPVFFFDFNKAHPFGQIIQMTQRNDRSKMQLCKFDQHFIIFITKAQDQRRSSSSKLSSVKSITSSGDRESISETG